VHAYGYVHIAIVMRYLISQVWREENTEINLRMFENASSNVKQKTKWKNVK